MNEHDTQLIEKVIEQVLLRQQDRADRAASETVSNLFHSLEAKLGELSFQFNEHKKEEDAWKKEKEPTFERIERVFAGGATVEFLMTKIMKFIVFVTVLTGALVGLKEWIKK
jgi:hypothetical protein